MLTTTSPSAEASKSQHATARKRARQKKNSRAAGSLEGTIRELGERVVRKVIRQANLQAQNAITMVEATTTSHEGVQKVQPTTAHLVLEAAVAQQRALKPACITKTPQ